MQRWYENKRNHLRDDPEDGFSSSSLRKQVSTSWIPASAGMTTGGDLQVCPSHKKRGRWPVVLGLMALAVLLGAGLLTLAVAQSGRSALSLNSPASFPVDI